MIPNTVGDLLAQVRLRARGPQTESAESARLEGRPAAWGPFRVVSASTPVKAILRGSVEQEEYLHEWNTGGAGSMVE